jgi:hypothetical protein
MGDLRPSAQTQCEKARSSNKAEPSVTPNAAHCLHKDPQPCGTEQSVSEQSLWFSGIRVRYIRGVGTCQPLGLEPIELEAPRQLNDTVSCCHFCITKLVESNGGGTRARSARDELQTAHSRNLSQHLDRNLRRVLRWGSIPAADDSGSGRHERLTVEMNRRRSHDATRQEVVVAKLSPARAWRTSLAAPRLWHQGQQCFEAGVWRLAAGLHPVDELGHINPAIAALAVVDPRMRLAQGLTEGALCQTGFLAEMPKELRDTSVTRGVLCLAAQVGQDAHDSPCHQLRAKQQRRLKPLQRHSRGVGGRTWTTCRSFAAGLSGKVLEPWG